MIEAGRFVEAARERGFALYSGVPCSYLQPFINYVISTDGVTYIGAANEGDAVAIGAGAELGGVRAVVMFQNSGLGNAVNPLTSCHAVFGLPILLIVTLRGEPGGPPDEPQHSLMGPITTRLLELMEIPWRYFPRLDDEIIPALDFVDAITREGRPVALVMRKGSVGHHALDGAPSRAREAPVAVPYAPAWARPERRDVLAAVRAHTRAEDIIVATTGFTGRALYALGDEPRQFYVVGAMGCASSIGLGLACVSPERRVVVVDGDGAVLMRMGALATLGHERPPNLIHVVLDNECHESTGGQRTVTTTTDLAQVAAACGYPCVRRAVDVSALGAIFDEWVAGLTFVHIKTSPESSGELPRPALTAVEQARRFRAWLQSRHT